MLTAASSTCARVVKRQPAGCHGGFGPRFSTKSAVKVATSPGITLLDAVTEVISREKASAFFISPGYAVKIARGYNRYRRNTPR